MYTKIHNRSQRTIDKIPEFYDLITKEEYELTQAWGLSTFIDLHECDPDLIKDKKSITEYAISLCKLLEVKAWGPCQINHFGANPEVEGYSMTQLIETSLLSGHFVNKTNRIFLDIFSCKYYDPIKAVGYSKEYFRAKDATFKCALRK